MRTIKLFFAGLALAGVAALVVLALGAAGSTRSLADTGAASAPLASNSMVWDIVSS